MITRKVTDEYQEISFGDKISSVSSDDDTNTDRLIPWHISKYNVKMPGYDTQRIQQRTNLANLVFLYRCLHYMLGGGLHFLNDFKFISCLYSKSEKHDVQ